MPLCLPYCIGITWCELFGKEGIETNFNMGFLADLCCFYTSMFSSPIVTRLTVINRIWQSGSLWFPSGCCKNNMAPHCSTITCNGKSQLPYVEKNTQVALWWGPHREEQYLLLSASMNLLAMQLSDLETYISATVKPSDYWHLIEKHITIIAQ